MKKLFCYDRLHTRVNYNSNCVVKPCKIKQFDAKLFCYGRLHTTVNYDSNCVVKPCETEKIYVKMFWLYMVDSTQESITIQTVPLSHVKKKQFDAKIISLWKTPHESQLRHKLCRQAM